MATRKRLTTDRAPPREVAEIRTVEQIGPNRAYTENGNLICYDVPIARIGWMIYDADEVPIEPNEQGYIRVYRGPEELFRPETLGSFAGVAVTDDHPEGLVTPANHRELSYGFSQNVRRGDGEDDDVILADLVITDRKAIEMILKNKLEISAGYEAEYVQKERGVGDQVDIIGNHIALVERGRCGPRCYIGDRANSSQLKGNQPMAIRKKLTSDTAARLRQLIKDADTLLEESGDLGGEGGTDTVEAGGTHIHIHSGGGGGAPASDPGGMPDTLAKDNAGGGDPNAGGDPIEQRFVALEGGMQQLQTAVAAILEKLGGGGGGEGGPPAAGGEGGEPTKDEFPEDLKDKKEVTNDSDDEDEENKRTMTGDSAALATGYQALMADAEVLMPGFRAPTFDSKAGRKVTVDSMCSTRRRVLDAFYMTQAGKEIVDTVTGKATLTLDSMDCKGVATTFRAAAGAQRLLNNRTATGDGRPGAKIEPPVPAGPKSIAQINKDNAAYWAAREAAAA